MVGTAQSEIPVAEGDPSRTLLQGLQDSLGVDNVTVVPYDRE